jgi:hypothetical protein
VGRRPASARRSSCDAPCEATSAPAWRYPHLEPITCRSASGWLLPRRRVASSATSSSIWRSYRLAPCGRSPARPGAGHGPRWRPAGRESHSRRGSRPRAPPPGRSERTPPSGGLGSRSRDCWAQRTRCRVSPGGRSWPRWSARGRGSRRVRDASRIGPNARPRPSGKQEVGPPVPFQQPADRPATVDLPEPDREQQHAGQSQHHPADEELLAAGVPALEETLGEQQQRQDVDRADQADQSHRTWRCSSLWRASSARSDLSTVTMPPIRG